jgi:hypothetical protein
MTADGRIIFGEGRWSTANGEAGFFTADDWLPAASLIGKTVNLGTKDGMVYDSVTVGGYTPDGMLTVRDGLVGWPHDPEREHRPPRPGECLPVTEIARGYIHAGPFAEGENDNA